MVDNRLIHMTSELPEALMTISNDGVLSFGEGVTPQDIAKAIAEAYSEQFRVLRAEKSLLLAVIVHAQEMDKDADLFLRCWSDGSADVDEEWSDWQEVKRSLVLNGKAADQPL